MERSFQKEVQALKLGAGETFRGEGILAVTKALLQSGVSYVGSYQGAPGSHLLDVIVDAEDLLANLGVHVLLAMLQRTSTQTLTPEVASSWPRRSWSAGSYAFRSPVLHYAP